MWKIIIGVLVVAILGVLGFMYYQSSQKKLMAPPAETMISPTQAEEPTPTDEPVDMTEFSIEILNGSGIVGKAGEVKDLIEGEGFVVDSTGNADTYDFDKTVIQAGKDVSPAFLKALRASLLNDYDVDTSFDEIAGDSTADVVIIVGKNDADGKSMLIEVTPEAKTTTKPTVTESVTTTPSPTP